MVTIILPLFSGRLATSMAAQTFAPVPAPIATDVTRTLARWIVAARFEDLPSTVRHEAARTLLELTEINASTADTDASTDELWASLRPLLQHIENLELAWNALALA